MLSVHRLKQFLSPVAELAQRKLFVWSEGDSDRLFVSLCLYLVMRTEALSWFVSGESGEGWNLLYLTKI